MLTRTGCGPVNRLAGRYSTPEIIVPSKLLHSTSSGAGRTSGLKLASLLVQRVTVPSEESIEYTSPCALTDARVNPISREPGRQRSCVIAPDIGTGSVRAF